MTKTILILAIAAIGIIGVSFAIFGFSNENPSQSTVSDIETNDIKSQGVATTLTPVTETIESSSHVISSEAHLGEVTSNELKAQSYHPDLNVQKAYGILPTQSMITRTVWSTAVFGKIAAFDSSFNFFSAFPGKFEIGFLNKGDLTTKTWTLPNDDRVRATSAFGNVVDVDSNGNLFFGKSDKIFGNLKLAKLNPATNVFTDYDIPGLSSAIGDVIVDSSDNVFFHGANKISKLVPSTNTLTSWNTNAGSFDIYLDTSGNLYLSPAGSGVGVLDTNTNTLTQWEIPNAFPTLAITSDTSGNIFFIFNDGVRNKLGIITISDNTLTEWVIPTSSSVTIRHIAVDSNGSVFFLQNKLIRLVPSTGTFTIWEGNSCETSLQIDSSDNLHCSRANAIVEFS